LLGNSYSFRYILDGISQLPKSIRSSSKFKSEFFGKDIASLKKAIGEKKYNDFVNKYKAADLSSKEIIDQMIEDLAYNLGGNAPASFKARRAINENLIAGIARKSSRKGMEGQAGYISKNPNKFIAKALYDQFGINAEKIFNEVGIKQIADLYMSEGLWGVAINGFENDPNSDANAIQDKGVKHPLFNAKFPGKNPFNLDGGYLIDELFNPNTIVGPSGKLYDTKASQMSAGSIYYGGNLSEGVKGLAYGKKGQESRGRRLFSEPVEDIANVSKSYKDRNGITTGPGEKITTVDVEEAKRRADAFEQMQNTPDDPQVKAAYQAMATETIDQFDELTKAGYAVEIYEGKGEPYANSQEMLDDLRNNKHLFVLSTEKDFGQNKITDKQRNDNPLLKDSGRKDINGKSLLTNDVFRFVHDAFGHGERGNSFGPIGEENAWDVHVRMYSPLAARAMTTETRGQNSWVNFGPHMRNEDGSIKSVPMKDRPFAEQKIGLLPEQIGRAHV